MPQGDTKKQTKRIEVFRPGVFTPMSGVSVTFSSDDLRAIADNYDPSSPAPAVVGHPKTDDPAYGWASAFSFDEKAQILTADIGELDPAFSDAVSAGRYKKISLSLFTPNAPNNPKPGAYYPKHIGFLGAAAPAVSGLKTVQFVGDETDLITIELGGREFGEPAFRDVAGVLRTMREWMIEKFGLETADKAISNWSIGWIEDASKNEPEPVSQTSAYFSTPDPKILTKPEKTMDHEKIAAQQAKLAAKEAQLTAREAALNHADNVSFASKLVNEARLLPALKDKMIVLLDGIVGGAAELSFTDAGTAKTASPLELIKDIFQALPPVVSFGHHDMKDAPDTHVDFAVADGAKVDPSSLEQHQKAEAYQAAHPGTDYLAAVMATGG